MAVLGQNFDALSPLSQAMRAMSGDAENAPANMPSPKADLKPVTVDELYEVDEAKVEPAPAQAVPTEVTPEVPMVGQDFGLWCHSQPAAAPAPVQDTSAAVPMVGQDFGLWCHSQPAVDEPMAVKEVDEPMAATTPVAAVKENMNTPEASAQSPAPGSPDMRSPATSGRKRVVAFTPLPAKRGAFTPLPALREELGADADEPMPEVATTPAATAQEDTNMTEVPMVGQDFGLWCHSLPAGWAPAPDWWTLPTPARQQHREDRARAAGQRDQLLEMIEENLQNAQNILRKSKPDWWTMPTPCRKDRRKSAQRAARRCSFVVAEMEKQLALAQGELGDVPSSARHSLGGAFSSDGESSGDEALDEEARAPRWTKQTLPVRKTDTLAKLRSFAQEQSAELGEVVGKKKMSKDAFFKTLIDRLKVAGLLG